jgi:hypothetical protein
MLHAPYLRSCCILRYESGFSLPLADTLRIVSMPHTTKFETAVRFGGHRRHNIQSETYHVMTQILDHKKIRII